MTKIFDIIHLNNHMYMIDKMDMGKSGDTIMDIIGRIWKNMEKCFHDTAIHQGCWKILASTDKSLGLPLLPEIKETEFDIVNKLTKIEGVGKPISGDKIAGFLLGYKADKAKKYTEEDIMKVLDIAQSACNMPHDGDVLISRNFIEQELKNLNPLLKQVEVEMDFIPNMWSSVDVEDEHTDKEGLWIPKVANNIIQIKRWLYE